MNKKELEKQLYNEGFRIVYIWRDGPNAFYPEHKHSTLTAHIILEGEMTITLEGEKRVVRSGERFDVPAHTIHVAKMGPRGCKYMIGEK